MDLIYTIGFTGKTAREFFDLLRSSGVKLLVDTRLNNTSQLSGFSKKVDLQFFLTEICSIDYMEAKEMAPSENILKAYKEKEISWDAYAEKYLNLMAARNIERLLDKNAIVGSCLLCSEHLPHHCHRKLAADYLSSHWGETIEVRHLIK